MGALVDMYTHDGWWQGTVRSVQGETATVQLEAGATWPARPDQLRCSLVWEDRSWRTVAGKIGRVLLERSPTLAMQQALGMCTDCLALLGLDVAHFGP